MQESPLFRGAVVITRGGGLKLFGWGGKWVFFQFLPIWRYFASTQKTVEKCNSHTLFRVLHFLFTNKKWDIFGWLINSTLPCFVMNLKYFHLFSITVNHLNFVMYEGRSIKIAWKMGGGELDDIYHTLGWGCGQNLFNVCLRGVVFCLFVRIRVTSKFKSVCMMSQNIFQILTQNCFHGTALAIFYHWFWDGEKG